MPGVTKVMCKVYWNKIMERQRKWAKTGRSEGHKCSIHNMCLFFLGVVGDFFLDCEDFFFRMFNYSFPTCVFFGFVFLKWRLACAHYFHSVGQDQSAVAQRAEMTVAKCSLTHCM